LPSSLSEDIQTLSNIGEVLPTLSTTLGNYLIDFW
jgi:hypothetical protein